MSDLDKLIDAVGAGGTLPRPLPFPAYQAAYVIGAYDGSLDAALALHKSLLPSDWIAEVDTTGFALVYQDEMEVTNNEHALLPGLPARAWLLAILRAYRQQRESGE